MLAVEPFGLDGAEEELGPVGVLPGIGHGERARPKVLQCEVLVSELVPVDRLAAGPILSLCKKKVSEAISFIYLSKKTLQYVYLFLQRGI